MDNSSNDKPPRESGNYDLTRQRVVETTIGEGGVIGKPSTSWSGTLARCHPTERAKAMRDLEKHWSICADRQEKLNARWGVPDPPRVNDSPAKGKAT